MTTTRRTPAKKATPARRRAAPLPERRKEPVGRESDLFALPGVTDPDPVTPEIPVPLMATLYRPTEVQLLTLARIGNALKSGDAPTFNILVLADEMISSLFAYQEEWDRFELARIRGEVDGEGYVDFIREVLTRFLPTPTADAPTTGPAPTRRKAARR
jgi:hypothetical protein